ncbi:MAG: hypothetical protein ACI4UN_03550 [Muribaculaceae bacterium]
MDTHLKFSDIIRYIFLGCIALIIVALAIVLYHTYCVCNTVELFDWIKKSNFNQYVKEVTDSFTIIAIAAIASFYFVGIIVQGIRMMFFQLLYYFKDTAPMSFLFGNSSSHHHSAALIAFFIRTFLFSPVFFYDISTYCRVLKFRNYSSSGYPKWIFISNHPEELCEIIEGAISSGKYRDDDRRYLNELLIGILAVVRIVMWVFLALPLFSKCLMLNVSHTLLVALLFLAIGFIITLIAKAYASEYIKSMGTSLSARCNDPEIMQRFNKLLASNGTPKVYILMRTCFSVQPGHPVNAQQLQYEQNLKRALDSINRQSYRNIMVIVLEDTAKKLDKEATPASKIIASYQDSSKFPFLFDKIAYSVENCGSPAASMIRIKELFFKTACDNDIAIMLDDDDALKRSDAIEDIVYMMNRRKANICLTSFESCGEISRDITNKGGGKHNELVNQLSTKLAGDFQPDLCYASSIGWTKAFRLQSAKTMHSLLSQYASRYRELKRYEDFPDFIAFLFSDSRICSVPTPTHLYYKDKGRITTIKNIADFEVARTGFLSLLLKMVVENHKLFTNPYEAEAHTIEFILFKTCQIEGIMNKYAREAKAKIKAGESLEEGEADFIGVVPGTFSSWLYHQLAADNLLQHIAKHLPDVKSADSFFTCVRDKQAQLVAKNIIPPSTF